MKLLASLALLASAVTANPILARDVSKPFHLETASASNPEHNGLYVYAYHTGAGLNDPVLTKHEGTASKAVLNGTRTEFRLGSGFPWGMVMASDTNYASWDPVRINAGSGTHGFAIKDHQLEWANEAFAGWLVCDWHHNAPQLFYLYSYLNAVIPSSCSKVDLMVKYIQ